MTNTTTFNVGEVAILNDAFSRLYTCKVRVVSVMFYSNVPGYYYDVVVLDNIGYTKMRVVGEQLLKIV